MFFIKWITWETETTRNENLSNFIIRKQISNKKIVPVRNLTGNLYQTFKKK